MPQVERGFLRDDNGGLVVTTDATGAIMERAYLRRPSDGALVVTTDATGAKMDRGFLRAPNGALVVSDGGAVTEILGGEPRTASGALACTSDATGARMLGGFLCSPSGLLVVSGLAFDPASIAGLTGWWDFSTLGLADGAAIATVPDLSGAGLDLSQATAGKRPAYKAGILNGLGVGRFDGTDDEFPAPVPGDDTWTVFVVAREASAITQRTVWGGSNHALKCFGTQWGYENRQDNSNVFLGGATTDWAVMCLRYNSTTSLDIFRHLAAALNIDPLDHYLSAGKWVGSNGGVEFWNGDIAEIVRYSEALSEADRITVRDYLRGKWGL